MKKIIVVLFIAACIVFGAPLFAKGTQESSEGAAKSSVAGPPPGQDPAKWSEPGKMPPEMVKGEGGYSHGAPSYGGTFRWFYNVEPPSAYEGDANFASLRFLEWTQEMAIAGNFEKYGPRGSGESNFLALAYQPEKYWEGRIIEDWEISTEKIVWHIRPGVFWAPTESQSAWMEQREFVAEDFAADTIRFLEGAWGSRFGGFLSVEGVKVVDKYTVEFVLDSYSPLVFYYIAYEDRGVQAPPS